MQPIALVVPPPKGRVLGHATGLPHSSSETAMSTSLSHQEKSLGPLSPAALPRDSLPVVELTPDHLHRAAALAKDRKKSYNSIDGGEVFGDHDSLSSHQVGILGEMAIAKVYQTKIDTETYAFGDDGTDLVLWGKTVDVKATATTKMQLPELLLRADSSLTADLYFLTHVLDWGPTSARVRLLGYAPQEQVVDREPRRHPGSMKNFVVEPAEMTPPPLLQMEQ